MSRGDDEPVVDFVQRFMSVFQDYKRESDGIKYPDSVLAMDLLDACKLSEKDDKIVSAQMTDPPDLSNLKTILKRVYFKEKTEKQQATEQVTTESTEKSTEKGEADLLFTKSKYNGRGTYRQPTGESSGSSSRGPYRQRHDERSERGNPYQRNPMGRVKMCLALMAVLKDAVYVTQNIISGEVVIKGILTEVTKLTFHTNDIISEAVK